MYKNILKKHGINPEENTNLLEDLNNYLESLNVEQIKQKNSDLSKKIEELLKKIKELKGEKINLKELTNELKNEKNDLLARNADLADIIKLETQYDKTSAEKRNLIRKNKLLRKTIDELEKRIELLLSIKNKPYKTRTLKIISRAKHGANAVLVASDWHIEENVDPSIVNGVNDYNINEAKRRSEKFFINSLILLEEFKNLGLEKRNGKKNELILALLGDFISGYIHEELQENNDLSPTEAIIELKGMIKAGINLFLKEGYPLIVPCNYGNHGRTTKKKRISTGYKNNYEWMMYKMLEDEYKNQKNIKFLVSNGYFNYLNLNGRILRFHHGDGINYGGGIGGPTIPINKAINRFNQTKNADIDIFGHFHQTLNHKNFVVNGSLIGTTPYGMKFGSEEPSQTLFVVDKHHGKTIHTPIYVNN